MAQNWRALIVTIVVIVPMLPALANKVNESVSIPVGLSNLFSINWIYGFVSSCVLYYGLNILFPDPSTLIPSFIGVDVVDRVVEGSISGDDYVDE